MLHSLSVGARRHRYPTPYNPAPPTYNSSVLSIYNLLVRILWPLLYLYPPFRGSMRSRMGQFDQGDWDAGAGGLKVLVNAVSAGEVVAISSFIRRLRQTVPGCQVALMTTTDSGQEMARGKLDGQLELLAYFPLVDHPDIVRRYLEKLRPDIYITTEAELWPNIQGQCRQRGIPVILVNGRLYLHNKTGLRRRVVKQLLEQLDLVVTQDEAHLENFASFGIPRGKLSCSGNIKFDFELEEWDGERMQAERAKLGLGDAPVVTAGSTHPGEEELALACLAAVRGSEPQARLLLAPRHVERVDEVARLVQRSGLRVVRLSDAESAAAGDWDVLLVDRYGVLVDMYRFADVVLMGGSFSEKVGGHNILEATVLGRAVVVGPHTFGIKAQMELLGDAGAVVQSDGSDAAELAAGLIADPKRRGRIGARARELTLANRGAAQRAVDSVLDCHRRLVGG